MNDIYTSSKLDDLADIMQVQARREFLLLTMSPDRVSDQLVREFSSQTNVFGLPSISAAIVAKPE